MPLQGDCRPDLASIEASPRREELGPEWQNMLDHQLPELPPIQPYLDGLRALFDWLEGRSVAVPTLPRAPVGAGEIEWIPPATISTWGAPVPLEVVRFAATNRLCIDLGYQGSVRRVEPYSLRRTQDGHLLLFAVRRDSRADRSYRVDRIQNVRVTQEGFTPVYPWSSGPRLRSAPHLWRVASPRQSYARPPRRLGALGGRPAPRADRSTSSSAPTATSASSGGTRTSGSTR